MIYVGVDPGKIGAVARMRDGIIERLEDVPTVKVGKKGNKREIDVRALSLLVCWPMLSEFKPASELFVTIEKQQAYPKQGAVSNFSTGRAFGQLEGVVAALGIPHLIVPPKTWQKMMTAGIPGDDPKGRSVIAATRLFPSMADQLRGPRGGIKDGRSDALLIAEYGRRMRR